MKKFITMLMTLIFTMFCFFSISAFAAEPEEIMPFASTYFDRLVPTISLEGDNKLSVDVVITARHTMDELGFTKIILQEKSGNTWTDIKTLNHSTSSPLISEDCRSYQKSFTANGAKGNSYRIKATVYAKDATGNDTKTYTTATITV